MLLFYYYSGNSNIELQKFKPEDKRTFKQTGDAKSEFDANFLLFKEKMILNF